jgi:hypothetical protein
MQASSLAMRASALLLAALSAGCGSDRTSGFGGASTSDPAPAPAPPPVNIAGRWQLSSPGRGQCGMTFGAPSPAAADGTIAPEGGCPGKFFTSRKWTYDNFGLVIRDHTGAALARLSAAGAGFDGKGAAGEPVTLMR